MFATVDAIETAVADADLVIGAVLLPGAATPKLISRALLRRMRPGSVIVDIAIDQGGCCETSRPTIHAHPAYVVDGVVHYCVVNKIGQRKDERQRGVVECQRRGACYRARQGERCDRHAHSVRRAGADRP